MKKSTYIFIVLVYLLSACHYIVVKHNPSVLHSTIELSGELTGDMYPEVRTMHMRATGQASNFLLLEIFGMESFCNSTSIEVIDSLAGNELFLSIVDNGTPGTKRCYRNARFWVGPFEKDEYYSLSLSETQNAIQRDELMMTFTYQQSLNRTISAGDHYYLLSDIPFDTVSIKHYEGNNVPDFDYTDWGYRDTLRFFDTDSGLLIRSILEKNCDVTHSADYRIINDTLIMHITLGAASPNFCSKKIFFDYLIPNYEEQIFYYKFYLTNSDWSMFEGFYSPQMIVAKIRE